VHGPLPDRYLEYSKFIEDSGTHLLSIINGILDLARSDANRLTLQEEALEVAETVALSEIIIGAMAQRGGIAFSLEIEEGLPRVLADSTKLQQILINLLSNAIKFTPSGGAVRLAVNIGETGDLVFCISDSGIGIPADKMELALAPFGQVDSRLSRKYDGAGLGLPLAKRLVELHGGKMEIDSEVDRGTAVTIRLPKERLLPQTYRHAGVQ
jgi:signal transduction histidine kinase